MAPGNINLAHIDHALSAFLDTPTPSSPNSLEIRGRSINNFLFLVEGNGTVYDAIRQLINDKTYWEKEDLHFFTINNLIRDWNARQGNWCSLEDVTVPPVAVIKQLYHKLRHPEVLGTLFHIYGDFWCADLYFEAAEDTPRTPSVQSMNASFPQRETSPNPSVFTQFTAKEQSMEPKNESDTGNEVLGNTPNIQRRRAGRNRNRHGQGNVSHAATAELAASKQIPVRQDLQSMMPLRRSSRMPLKAAQKPLGVRKDKTLRRSARISAQKDQS